MKSKLFLLPVLIIATVALASCGSGGSSTVTSTETQAEEEPAAGSEATAAGEPKPAAPGEKLERSVKVDISGYAYNPDPVRVEAGGKVIWLNEDSVSHTATADDGSFDTGEIQEGKLKSETFKTPGVYTYHCEIHPQMHGTIEVVEG
jgi:plastocyanin